MNFRIILRLLGVFTVVLSFLMATSLICAYIFEEAGTVRTFLLSSGITLFTGLILYAFGRKEKGTIGRREALFVVSACWFLAGIVGALPFLMDGAFTSFADAFFEAVSGFTTTGSTVLTDIESLSHGLHYWRTLTQWLGGMGIVVLFVAIFPQLGVGAKHLFKSEAPGPITEGLKPKIKETASTLWRIYVGLTILETGLLYLAGMDMFNAVCHSFATMATGGFSTKNASIAHFDSATVDLIITLFMFFAGINFTLYYLALRGNLRLIWKDPEFRVYSSIVAISILVVMMNILAIHPDLFKGLRYASFQVVSIATTTGFGTDNFDVYPTFSRILLLVLMVIGGSAGSTAGGMKISRIMVVSKATFAEVYRVFRPQAVRTVKLGKSVLSDEITKSIFGFFALGIFVIVAGSLFMGLLGLDIVTAVTSVVATLFNIGPGLERVGAIENFAFIPASGKMFLSFCMILGRLELYTVLVLLIPDFWKR